MTDETLAYLSALMGRTSSGRYLEVRYRRGQGMGQLFFSAHDIEGAARVIRGLGARTDVYVGVAPRAVPAGGRAAIASAAVAWADCDTPDARVRLQAFTPRPTLVVRSGSPGACHAYWMLDRALLPAGIEQLNRRLAEALAADPQSVDVARILRPPGTNNFKYTPPAAVELACQCDEQIDLRRLDRALPLLPEPPARPQSRGSRGGRDALLEIPPADYVRALLGVEARPGRKIACPFHDDDTASLHVYEEPGRGWYCYGCGRGGSIYDLAAQVWGRETRGSDFLTVRRRLHRIFAL